MPLKIKINANVSYWPDYANDWDDEDEGEWIVGVPFRGVREAAYKVNEGDMSPNIYESYCTCDSKQMAVFICGILRAKA